MARWLSSLVILMILGVPPWLEAHPIARQHHDRTVLLRLMPEGLIVEYVLALDGWTLASDLVPFRDVDLAGKPEALYEAYAKIYGPRIAEGLVASVDGQELGFKCAKYELRIEDHLRYNFTLRASWNLDSNGSPHRLILTDTNFALEPGQFKLAARSERQVELKHSNVADDPEKARSIPLQGLNPEKHEQDRSAKITFTIPLWSYRASASAEVAPAGEPPAQFVLEQRDQGLWDVVTTLDIRQLLETRFGLALVLILAFFFGAAHALQPGHGKTLVAAYLVGEKGTVFHAFFLGLVTTITHTGVVIILAIVLPLVFPEAQGDVAFGLALGCGFAIVLMSIWLLLKRLAGQADHVHLFGGHHHHGSDGSAHHHLPTGDKVSWLALVTLGVTGGIVPCVDALALLTTTLVTNQLWLGLPLILVFSAGLASVLVLTGVLVVKFKQFASSRWGQGRVVRILPIVSAVATLLLGLWMCHDAVRQWRMPPASPLAATAGSGEGVSRSAVLTPGS